MNAKNIKRDYSWLDAILKVDERFRKHLESGGQ